MTIRLRRDLRGWLFGVAGGTVLLLWFLFLIAAMAGMVAGMIVIGSLIALSYASGVTVSPKELRAGNRLRPRRWARTEIVEAREGQVAWLRGTPVPGVHLLLADGTTEWLPCSQLLGASRRRRWVQHISEWCSAEPKDRPN